MTKTGLGTLVLSGINDYTGATIISDGLITLTGSTNALSPWTISSGANLDLQVSQTFASLNLDGNIVNNAGVSSLTVTGASNLAGSATTSGDQTYTGSVLLSGDTSLNTEANGNVSFI